MINMRKITIIGKEERTGKEKTIEKLFYDVVYI